MSRCKDGVSVTVVPAHPGWNVLVREDDEEGRATGFYREPIVAWRVEVSRALQTREIFTTVYPVPVEGWNGDDPIERPDGRIIFPAEADFASETDALEYMNERAHP